MTLVSLLVTLIVLGIILYIIESLLPIDIRFKRVIEAVFLLIALIYILNNFGLFTGHAVS